MYDDVPMAQHLRIDDADVRLPNWMRKAKRDIERRSPRGELRDHRAFACEMFGSVMTKLLSAEIEYGMITADYALVES